MSDVRQARSLQCIYVVAALMLAVTVASCRAGGRQGFDLRHCIIPQDQIVGGGPGKDGIPAITDPEVVPAASAGYLRPEDPVVGVEVGGKTRAYPLRVLVWHENVNDTLGGQPIAVSYCPLCNSAIVFDRKVGGEVREFGISGLLWNSNVLLYDRQGGSAKKESLWSQVGMRAVCGPAARRGLKLEALSSQLLSWQRWRRRHPETTVLSLDTGYSRNYGRHPYERYFRSDGLMFPVTSSAAERRRFPNKEQMVVISVGGRLKAYARSEIARVAGGDARMTDTFAGARMRFTYHRDTDRVSVRFLQKPEDGGETAVAHMFWFAWKSVYPDAPVFTPSDRSRPQQPDSNMGEKR